jgi:sulfur carrier protein
VSGITVNGSAWGGAPDPTIADLVAAQCPSPKGVAVARNGEVVPRSGWDDTRARPGDRIEIVSAAAGG